MAQRESEVIAPVQGTNVGIIGLGIVGNTSARLAARAGYRVLGYDLNPARLREISSLLEDASHEVSSSPSVLTHADVIIIAVRAPTGTDGITDSAPLQSAWNTVLELPDRERLILIETTMPPRTTRRLASQISQRARALLHVAHCPERLRVGDSLENLDKVPRLVGGLDPTATRLGCEFLRSLGISAAPVSQPEIAELAKLLENAFLTTGIALMGEITRIAHALGVSAAEVADAAATKPHGYFPFRPGPAVGGHCLLNDMRMLRSAAQSFGIESELFHGVQQAADRLNGNVIARLNALLAARGASLRGACIWIIGVGFKVGSNDVSGSAAFGLVRLLREQNCSVVLSDSMIEALVVDDEPVPRADVESPSFQPLASLLLSGDPMVSLDDVAARCEMVLDLGGSRIMRGYACNMERL